MTNLKKMCMAMIVMAVGLCVLAKQGQQGGCAGVREKLLLIKQQMGAFPDCCRMREEAPELELSSNETFCAMSQMVANCWPRVLAGLDSITTNQNERLVVIYAGVGVGETNFLSRISQMADMVFSNKVSLAELQFYKTQWGIADHHAASVLVRRYQETSVSNLIMKLRSIGAYPQGVSHIFSGAERELYLDAVHDGLIGP